MMEKNMMKGFTVLELMVVIAVSSILMGIAGFEVHDFIRRYDVERQVRQLHADMMDTRLRAVHRNRACFLTITSTDYQITEDTNDNGGPSPDKDDIPLWPSPKQFKYRSLWTGTIIMHPRGLTSLSTRPLLANETLVLRFDTSKIVPEFDCITVKPTRIRAGKWSGMKCATR